MSSHTTQEKVRAVFLATLMVVSVFGATVAFAGAAAGAVNDASVSDTTVKTGATVTVSGTDDAGGNDSQVYVYLDESDDDQFTHGEDANWSLATTDGESFSEEITLPSDVNRATMDLFIVETEKLESGDTGAKVATLTFDDKAPVLNGSSPAAGETINSVQPTIKVYLDDPGATEIAPETIEVTVEQDGVERTYLVNVGKSADGVSYDAASSTLMVDMSAANIPDLVDGQVTVTVSAADEAGNTMEGSFQFMVDTGAPNFELVQPTPNGVEVGQQDQPVTVDIVDSDVDSSNVSARLVGPNGNTLMDLTNDFADYDAQNSTFIFGPDVPEDGTGEYVLPNGQITVEVSATDVHGNANSATYTFYVDNMGLDATDVQFPAAYNTSSGTQSLTVAFNDTVDDSSVEVVMDLNGDGSVDKTVSSFSGGGATAAVASVHIPGAYNTEEASIEVTHAQDNVGNSLIAEDDGNDGDVTDDDSATFDLDTIAPEVSNVDSYRSELSGYVDLTNASTVSAGDSDSVTVSYELKKLEKGDMGSVMVSDFAYFDTRTVEDGEYNLATHAEDDDGNADSATRTLTFDNVPGTVSVVNSPETISGSSYNLSNVFSTNIETTSASESIHFSYAPYDEVSGTFGSWHSVSGSTLDTTALDEGLVKIRATIMTPDGAYDSVTTVTEVHNVVGRYGIGPNPSDGVYVTNANGDKTVTVIRVGTTSSVTLTNQHYFQQEKLSVSGYTTTGDRHVAMVDVSYDDVYAANVGGDSAVVDTENPHLIDAEIVNANKDTTVVHAQFNEPVTGLEMSDLSVEGDTIVGVDTSTAGSGHVHIGVEGEFQTADAPNVTAANSSYSERVGDASSNPSGDATEVATIELDLEKGTNFVSVPVETGEIELSSLDTSNVQGVWTYEDGSWQAWAPGAMNNSLDSLEGGQGYIFVMDAADSIEVNGYNIPAAGEGQPNVPTTEDIEAGWNLLGHYQEGPQSVAQTFVTADDSITQVMHATGGEYVRVSELDAGNAYWVSAEKDDGYTATPYGASLVSAEQVGNNTVRVQFNAPVSSASDRGEPLTPDDFIYRDENSGGAAFINDVQQVDSDTYLLTLDSDLTSEDLAQDLVQVRRKQVFTSDGVPVDTDAVEIMNSST